MGDGLEVPVSAPGLSETAHGFERLDRTATGAAKSMVQTSGSVDRLASKLQSGQFIRNASASFALMATSGAGLNDKITALAASLAAIPGPIGLIASGAAVASTVFGVFSKEAEEAARQTEALGKALDALNNQKGAAQQALADRIGGAAKAVGGNLRAFNHAGGSQAELNQSLNLFEGDAKNALKFSTAVAQSGLSDENKAGLFANLKAETLQGGGGIESAMKSLEEAITNFGGEAATPEQLARVRTLSGEGSGGTTLQNQSLNQADRANDNFRTAQLSASIAGGRSTIDTAGAPLTATGVAALEAATDKAAGETEALTQAIIDLTKKISETQSKQKSSPREAGWGWTGWGSRATTATSPP